MGELRVQRCSQCGRLRFYPTEACPGCGALQYRWKALAGFGKVYTWTVVRRSVDPYWQARTPYIPAVVAIAEQDDVLVPGLLTDVDPHEVSGDMAVEVWFEPLSRGAVLHRWRPRR